MRVMGQLSFLALARWMLSTSWIALLLSNSRSLLACTALRLASMRCFLACKHPLPWVLLACAAPIQRLHVACTSTDPVNLALRLYPTPH